MDDLSGHGESGRVVNLKEVFERFLSGDLADVVIAEPVQDHEVAEEDGIVELGGEVQARMTCIYN